MNPKYFSIPYDIVNNLSAGERFVYYEFCRLAATKEHIDPVFKIRVPQGALVTSHYRMSKILDLPYVTTALSIEQLYEKKLIAVRPVEFEDFYSYYMVKVVNFQPPSDTQPHQTYSKEQIYPPY